MYGIVRDSGVRRGFLCEVIQTPVAETILCADSSVTVVSSAILCTDFYEHRWLRRVFARNRP